MTPAEYRALAARVETEEPTEALNEDVALALGWKHYDRSWWIPPGLETDVDHLPDFLTDLTAAASATPEGDVVVVYRERKTGVWGVSVARLGDQWFQTGHAPTEPRARVAAALRARAAGMEASL